MRRFLLSAIASLTTLSDYQRDGTPVGMANVETTSLAILALDDHQNVGSGAPR